MNTITLNVMAPLVVGSSADPNGKPSESAWAEFDGQLAAIKLLGADAVSTDVWWGLVEPEEGQFNWTYYDKLVQHILAAGLKWVPILSFHECGGNIGDDVNVPVPAWVFTKLAALTPDGTAESVKYVSEQGNASDEFVSCWAIPLALSLFRKVMGEFQGHFIQHAANIAEINVSLGPAGELRYPSYNHHDKNTNYPTRGALQCYSSLARQSFFAFVMAKYGDLDKLTAAWGEHRSKTIQPPADPESFFANGEHFTAYGKDFFDWYQDSLLEHGRLILTAAFETFSHNDAAFKGIEIGAKFPGIHWRIGKRTGNQVTLGDRLAELACGLIRTSSNDWDKDEDGRGYRNILGLFSGLVAGGAPLVLHFTCLEIPDGDGAPEVQSLAQGLVTWVGAEARRQHVRIKGENALGWNIPLAGSWSNMRKHLALPGVGGPFEGLTLLRMGEILISDVAKSELRKLATDRVTTTGDLAA